jgi:amino acid transporter
MAVILLSYPWVASGGSLTLGVLLCAVGSAFHVSMYAFLAMTMPRSGGDYVWVSRILHPAIGFAQSLVIVVSGLFWFGVTPGIWLLMLRNMISLIGAMAGNTGIISAANIFSIPWMLSVIGILLAVFFIFVLFFGQKLYFKIQTTLIVFVFLTIGLFVILALFTDHATFITRFNNLAWYLTGDHNYAQTLVNQATSDSLLPIPQLSGGAWGWATLAVMPIAFWSIGYPYFSTYIAGEWKEAKMTALVSCLGGLAICVVVILASMMSIISVAGEPLVQALANGYYVHPNTYFGIAPYAYLYAAGLTDNLLVFGVLCAGSIAMAVLSVFVALYPLTRCIFAWAFDRVVPEKLGSVSMKYHVPIPAILLSGVGGIIVVLLFQYVYSLAVELTISIIISTVIFSFTMVALTAIILPWRRREIYETSPIQYKFLGFPVISLLGIVDLIFLSFLGYSYVSVSAFGSFDWGSYEFFTVLFLLGIIGYYISRAYRKRQKIDLDLTFREIPPA